MSTDRDTIETMARLLRCKQVDIGDERAVLRTLNTAYRAGEVMALYELAIEAARLQSAEFGEPQ